MPAITLHYHDTLWPDSFSATGLPPRLDLLVLVLRGAAMAEHYNHAAELRDAFRPALEKLIIQIFADTDRARGTCSCIGRKHRSHRGPGNASVSARNARQHRCNARARGRNSPAPALERTVGERDPGGEAKRPRNQL
jgi:hypothetical protein